MAQHHVVAVSHIDMAFVMRKEAYEEMLEILLERIVGAMERNPEIHFALEQVAHYRKLKQRRPDLFSKVNQLLHEGRLEFMGGMATTMETNFPNGECLIRNQGMGLRWLEENMGVKPHSGWMIDTFGLNPQIPQIMEQFGFKYLHANRFGGDKSVDIFQAEGLNGSKVIIIGCDSNSTNVRPETQALIFCRAWGDVDKLFAKADRLRGDLPKLVTYYIENEEVFSEYYLKLTKQRQETGEWKHSTYKAYTNALDETDCSFPVISDDLNPEFTGTFALRTPIKTENRKTETMLLDAEMWYALLSDEQEDPFEDAWWDLFHCQFHDAFTGSQEDITYEDILGKLSQIRDRAMAVQKKTLRIEQAENQIVCCNNIPTARKAWVCVDEPGENNAVYDGDRKLPACRAGDRLYFLADLPAMGVCGFSMRKEEAVSKAKGTGKFEISNSHLRLCLNERDGIGLLEDSQGFAYIRDAGNFLEAEQDTGGMQIEQCEGKRIYASSGNITVEEAVSDIMGEHIVMRGQFPCMFWKPQNSLSWSAEFSLRPEERFVRVKLALNWVGDGTRIRLNLPLTIAGRDCYHEVPFGVKRRDAYHTLPTAKGEWPVQRFAALEDGCHGVALVNKGVAGVQQIGKTLATTLIRAYQDGPDAWVKPTPLSNQQGQRVFEFLIVPYEGNYRDADMISTAQSFNRELSAIPGRTDLGDGEKSFLEIHGKGLYLSAVKKAWDGGGDLVVRIYESEGRKTRGVLKIPGAWAAWKCNLREDNLEQLMCSNYTIEISLAPYEIATVRIERN